MNVCWVKVRARWHGWEQRTRDVQLSRRDHNTSFQSLQSRKAVDELELQLRDASEPDESGVNAKVRR